jgi:hypothetical protein
MSLATDTLTNPETLRYLARHEYAGIRQCVAANNATPPDVLVSLANDWNRYVLRALVSNSSTPQEVKFLLMLEHPEWIE